MLRMYRCSQAQSFTATFVPHKQDGCWLKWRSLAPGSTGKQPWASTDGTRRQLPKHYSSSQEGKGEEEERWRKPKKALNPKKRAYPQDRILDYKSPCILVLNQVVTAVFIKDHLRARTVTLKINSISSSGVEHAVFFPPATQHLVITASFPKCSEPRPNSPRAGF